MYKGYEMTEIAGSGIKVNYIRLDMPLRVEKEESRNSVYLVQSKVFNCNHYNHPIKRVTFTFFINRPKELNEKWVVAIFRITRRK
jgi:hypothetical protein